MKLIFNLLIRTILDSPSLLLPLLDALKLWCLNLVFPLCFIIFLPIFVVDLTGIPFQEIKKDIFNLIDENEDLSKQPFSKLIVDMSKELGII